MQMASKAMIGANNDPNTQKHVLARPILSSFTCVICPSLHVNGIFPKQQNSLDARDTKKNKKIFGGSCNNQLTTVQAAAGKGGLIHARDGPVNCESLLQPIFTRGERASPGSLKASIRFTNMYAQDAFVYGTRFGPTQKKVEVCQAVTTLPGVINEHLQRVGLQWVPQGTACSFLYALGSAKSRRHNP